CLSSVFIRVHLWLIVFSLNGKAIEVAQQSDVHQGADGAGDGGGPEDGFVAALPGVDRRRQEPHLQEDDEEDEAEYALQDGRRLCAGQGTVHRGLISTATA